MAGLLVLLGSLLSYTPAQALPVPQAFTCSGIPVVVDFAALGGGTQVGCATSYSNGTYALRNAGFYPYLDAGMITKIKGLPTTPNTAQNYWSYWHATRQADGSYSGWSYSSLGSNAFQPGPNDAEGWRYEPTNGAYVPPSVLPPKQVTATQAPATTAPAPATAAKTTAAPRTTAATTATTTAAAAATSASATDPPTPSASDSPSDSATPSDLPPDTPTSSPDASSTAAGGSGTGAATRSLLGGLGAIGAIAAGAGGVLWWRKRGLPGA